VNKRLARWIVVHAGNLAVKLAPQAGFDLVFRLRSHKRNQKPAGIAYDPLEAPPTRTTPELFEATCLDCGCDAFEFHGHEGAMVLQYFCIVCQGRRWRVAPVIPDHQQSRKVEP
jgi:hypothetical protein